MCPSSCTHRPILEIPRHQLDTSLHVVETEVLQAHEVFAHRHEPAHPESSPRLRLGQPASGMHNADGADCEMHHLCFVFEN